MPCCAVFSRSVMSDSANPWTVARQAPLSMGILQVRILESVAMPSSKGSSQPRDQIQASCIACRFFTIWTTREPPYLGLLTTFWLVGFLYFIAWIVCIFWKLSSFWSHHCKYFLPFRRLSFHFVYSFFCYAKLVSLIRSHLFIFAFISIALAD